MQIIGLTGKKRSGKDTVANILSKNYGYQRVAFADKLREILYSHFGVEEPQDKEGEVSFFVKDVALRAIAETLELPLKAFGDKFIEQMSPWVKNVNRDYIEYEIPYRKLLQVFGTEVCRGIRETVWEEQLKKEVSKFVKYGGKDKFVISDVRFDNEAEVADLVWEVVGRGVTGDGHISEQGVDPSFISCTIDNTSSKEVLEKTVEDLMGSLKGNLEERVNE